MAVLGGAFTSGTASADPYGGSRWAIPGRIEAEDYDTGGQNSGYYDTTSGNEGGAYRDDDVDIETGGDNYNVGWTEAGEWLNYSSTVDSTDTYDVTVRVASGGGGGTLVLEQDGNSVATADAPDTGGWQSWTTVTVQADLDGGDRRISIYVDSGGVNIDWMDFSLADGGTTQSPYGRTSGWPVPGSIEAEDFDEGGQDVAYYDTTAGNDGGASYRDTDVDIEDSTENGYNICWTVTDEWWEYTVDVDSDGTYDLDLRVASDLGGGQFHVEVDGTDVTGSVSFDATGGWQAWATVSAGSIDLTAGEHVVRVYSEADDWNLNWIDFTSSSSGTTDNYPNLDGNDWELAWSDEFDQGSLDTTTWTMAEANGCDSHSNMAPCGWGNNELQYYTTDGSNAWVDSGTDRLIIEARREEASCSHGTYDYTSARLHSRDKFEKQYGRVEFRARLPGGVGTWPALWMLGHDISSPSDWPGCGEIDVMEQTDDNTTEVHQTLHGPGYSGGDGPTATHYTETDCAAEFQDFQITWYQDVVKFWVNGNHVHTVTADDVSPDEWVFNKQFFLLMNIAIGGDLAGDPSNTSFPRRMEVEYVRVYDYV